MIRVLVAATLVLGCTADGVASPKPAPGKKEKIVTATPVEWSLAKSADGKSLAVDIRVTNATDAPLWVADKLVAPKAGGKMGRSDRLTVMNTDDPKTIRFVLGAVSSDRPSATIYQPTFIKVAPGESVQRSFAVPLPLTSWNPVGGADPLSAQANQATLFVHTSRVEPKGWTNQPSDDSEPLRTPEWGRALTILEGKTLPLP